MAEAGNMEGGRERRGKERREKMMVFWVFFEMWVGSAKEVGAFRISLLLNVTPFRRFSGLSLFFTCISIRSFMDSSFASMY